MKSLDEIVNGIVRRVERATVYKVKKLLVVYIVQDDDLQNLNYLLLETN